MLWNIENTSTNTACWKPSAHRTRTTTMLGLCNADMANLSVSVWFRIAGAINCCCSVNRSLRPLCWTLGEIFQSLSPHDSLGSWNVLEREWGSVQQQLHFSEKQLCERVFSKFCQTKTWRTLTGNSDINRLGKHQTFFLWCVWQLQRKVRWPLYCRSFTY